MEKKKKHKWKYQINIRKKVLVLVILGVFLFVGLGYAVIESNLGMTGTLEVSKLDKTLYGVFKKEVNKGYAAKYSGDHQDSIDASKSTEDIYHFNASTDQKGTDILNKNNVVFADTCWQMIRTTDTGGVKLLYNGDPETTVVDGVTHYNCGDTRSLYHIGGILSEYNLSGTKIYAKNYTATTNGTTTTFTLVDDPNDPDDYKSISVTSSDAQSKIEEIAANYPYTCGTSDTCTNANFYKVVSQSSGTQAYTYKSTHRDNIGLSNYNRTSTPASAGYKYGNIYNISKTGIVTQNFTTTQTVLQQSANFSSSYYYSKTLNLTGTSSVYELDNPILGSQIPEDTYEGYYTYKNSYTLSGTQPYYLVAKNGSTGSSYYHVQLSSTKDLAGFNIQVGTDLVDNGDNTYTVKNGVNQATVVTPADWYNNYASYVGKYTCGDTSDTCQTPRYITASTVTNYTYFNVEKITIAKSRNGLVLNDYITVRKDDWYSDYGTYGDYKYTCGNDSTTCTEANLRYISSYTATSYKYYPNRYFGKSVKYENDVYKLQNIEEIETLSNLTTLSNHHYICLDLGVKECPSVAYVFYYNGTGDMYYITLNNPNAESVQDALDEMFNKNDTDSRIKTIVDKWYENNLLNTLYELKLDDTIYCNDRSYSTKTGQTFVESGWNEDGGSTTKYLYFNGAKQVLKCNRVEDEFSVSNNKAPLTYKIGLLNIPELNLSSRKTFQKTDYQYWTMTPFYITQNNPSASSGDVKNYHINISGTPSNDSCSRSWAVRPAISLVAGTKYSSGNGSMDNPYVVDMSE